MPLKKRPDLARAGRGRCDASVRQAEEMALCRRSSRPNLWGVHTAWQATGDGLA